MNILVSACLLGLPCRYDGDSKEYPQLKPLLERHQLIPFCPEVYGGLTTPRSPAEIRGKRVINQLGEDVTAQFDRGALMGLSLIDYFKCPVAILKDKSPSCGSSQVYDGSFSRKLIPGDGVFTRLLRPKGVIVFSEKDISTLEIL